MSDIDDFMQATRPTGKSKLDRYKADILTLKQHGYSNSDVLRFLLEKKNVKAGSATLTRFLAKHRENSLGKSGARTVQPEDLSKTGSVGSVPTQPETATGTKPFNWEEAKKEDWHDLI